MDENEDQLGSLAQSTRGHDLGKTRGILIFIGVMTMLINGVMFGNAENELNGLRNQGMVFEDNALSLVRMIYGAGILLGMIFFVSGILVKKYPVPLTILSLVLYVGATAGFAFLNPASLAQGAIVKIIIVVALGKSVQTALAYQRDRDAGFAV